MDAKELRIGNYVNAKPNHATIENVAKIIHITKDWCEFCFNNPEYFEDYEADLSEISPIPLTPEILERCGFEYNNGIWHNKISLYLGADFYVYNAAYFEYDQLIEVPYLHNLQNLYFCLCGTELTFKV